MPPTNPTPHLYPRIMWNHTMGHMGGSNTWRGYPVEGYYVTLTNGVVVCPSQIVRYHAEGCNAVG